MKASSYEDILNGTFSFEVDGIKMTDTPMAIFMKDGKPFVSLFVRESFIHLPVKDVTNDISRIRELFAFSRMVSDPAINHWVKHMAPWGGDPLNPKELGQLYDGPGAEEREQLREMLASRFQGENWNWFVHSIVELEKSAFYKPTEADGIERFAQRSNIQKAFEDAKGDVVKFAETLAALEHGRMDGKFMAETFDTFQNYAHLLSEMVRNEGEEVRRGGPHHLRRCRVTIYGARMVESAREFVPEEWLDFAPHDAYNMQRVLCDQMWQAAAAGADPLLGTSMGRNSKTMDENLSSAAPMAMTPAGDVYAVIGSDVKGFFTRTAHLTLKDGKNNTVKLKLPLASVMRGFEETAGWFLAWAKMCSPIIQPPDVNFIALPKLFFARNTSL